MRIAKDPIQKRVGHLHLEIPIKHEGSSKKMKQTSRRIRGLLVGFKGEKKGAVG